MRMIKSFTRMLLIAVVVGAAVIFVVYNYEYVFSKRVRGTVIDVQRVTAASAVIGGNATEAQLYSYSVLLQGDDGVLYTSSSEDRQWQVVKKGYCVDALLYRNAPWNISKGNTFFNARVEQIRICPGATTLPDGPPSLAPADVVPQPGGPPSQPATVH